MNNVSNTIIEFEENCKPEFNQRKASKTELRSELSERSTHQRSNDSFSGIYLNFWYEGTKPMLSGYK